MLASLIHTSSLYPHVLRLCRVGFVVYICVQLPEQLADASVRSQLVPGAFSAGWLCGNHICFRQLLHFVIVVEAHYYAAAVQWGIVCSPKYLNVSSCLFKCSILPGSKISGKRMTQFGISYWLSCVGDFCLLFMRIIIVIFCCLRETNCYVTMAVEAIVSHIKMYKWTTWIKITTIKAIFSYPPLRGSLSCRCSVFREICEAAL